MTRLSREILDPDRYPPYSDRLAQAIANAARTCGVTAEEMGRALRTIPRSKWRTITTEDVLGMFAQLGAQLGGGAPLICRACRRARRKCDNLAATGKLRPFRRHATAPLLVQHEIECRTCARKFWTLTNPEAPLPAPVPP